MTDSTPPSTKTRKKKTNGHEVKIQENEIRVTAQGKMRNYVAYASTIFAESKSNTVVLKGMGRVINKTVSLAEILKRRVKGLYQLAEIGSIQVVDKKTNKGNEEATEVVRLLSVIKIILTTAPEDRAKYQPPVDEVLEEPVATTPPKKNRTKSRRKPKKLETPEQETTKTTAPPKGPPKQVDTQAEGTPAEAAATDKKSEAKPKTKRRPNRKPKKAKKAAEKEEVVAEDAEVVKEPPEQMTSAEEAPVIDTSA